MVVDAGRAPAEPAATGEQLSVVPAAVQSDLVALGTEVGNQAAVRLYEKAGFRTTGMLMRRELA